MAITWGAEPSRRSEEVEEQVPSGKSGPLCSGDSEEGKVAGAQEA